MLNMKNNEDIVTEAPPNLNFMFPPPFFRLQPLLFVPSQMIKPFIDFPAERPYYNNGIFRPLETAPRPLSPTPFSIDQRSLAREKYTSIGDTNSNIISRRNGNEWGNSNDKFGSLKHASESSTGITKKNLTRGESNINLSNSQTSGDCVSSASVYAFITMDYSVCKGDVETGISDGGCLGAVISHHTYATLLSMSLIPALQPMFKPTAIAFGTTKDGTHETVIGEVLAPGMLLDNILVVQSIAAPLIGDTVFTEKGILLIKDDAHMVGIYGGKVVLKADRNKSPTDTTLEQLWCFDLTELCTIEDPRVKSAENQLTLASTLKTLGIALPHTNLPMYVPAMGAAPKRYNPDAVRTARLLIKGTGLPANTIAKMIREKAWRGIPDNLDENLFRKIAEKNDDISHILARSRQTKLVGSGIGDPVGYAITFDSEGKFNADVTGCCYSGSFCERRCGYGKFYLMIGKDAMLGGLRLFLMHMKSYGFSPQVALCDAASEVGAVFKECAIECGLRIEKNAPEDPQGHNERQYQSVKHDMCANILRQNNLTIKHWGYFMIDARERRNACINSSHPTMTPEEQITGKVPLYSQMLYHCGQLAAAKRTKSTTGQDTWSTNYELVCVVGSPNTLPGVNLVLRQGESVASIRKGLKPIKEYEIERSEADWNKLMPVFGPDGEVLRFHSGAAKDFTLRDLLLRADKRNFGRTPTAANPTSQWQGRVTVDGEFVPFTNPRRSPRSSIQLEPNAVQTEAILRTMTETPAKPTATATNLPTSLPLSNLSPSSVDTRRTSIRIAESASSRSQSLVGETILCMPETADILAALERTDDNSGDEVNAISSPTNEHGEDTTEALISILIPACIVSKSLLTTFETIMSHGSTLREAAESFSASRIVPVFKARPQRTDANPTMQQVLKSKDKQDKWGPSVRKFIDDGLRDEIHRFVSYEYVKQNCITILPHVNIFSTKRIEPGEEKPKLKYRFTPDGSKESPDIFAFGSTASSPIDNVSLFQAIAIGASLGLAFSKADVSNAFPAHNKWTDPLCKNPRRICTLINAFQSGTGKSEYLEYLTCTNGLKDASAFWQALYTRGALRANLRRSVTTPSLLYRNDGNDGLLVVGVIVDDSLKMRSMNAAGNQMDEELKAALINEGFVSTGRELSDHPDGMDFGGFTIKAVKNEYGSGLSITMPSIAESIGEFLEGMGTSVPIATDITWLPMIKEWTPLKAAQSAALGTDRADTTTYLRLLGMVMWTNTGAIRSAMPSILSSYSLAPGAAELECLIETAKHFLSTATVPLVFYKCEDACARGTNSPAILHVYVDAGEDGQTDGRGRKSIIAKIGKPGTPSGAFLSASNKVKRSTSTPSDEMEAMADSVSRIDMARTLAEEIAGLRPNVHNTDITVPKSQAPTTVFIKPTIVDSLSFDDVGDTGCRVRTQTLRCLEQREGKRNVSISEPSVVFGDSQIVMNVVASDGNIKYKGLRPSLRLIASILQAKDDGIIEPTKISSSDNLSNPLSKTPAGPLDHIMGLQGLVGQSPEMDLLRSAATTRFAKTRRTRELDSELATVPPSWIPQWVLPAFASFPPWLNTSSAPLISSNPVILSTFIEKQSLAPEVTYPTKSRTNIGINEFKSRNTFQDKVPEQIDSVTLTGGAQTSQPSKASGSSPLSGFVAATERSCLVPPRPLTSSTPSNRPIPTLRPTAIPYSTLYHSLSLPQPDTGAWLELLVLNHSANAFSNSTKQYARLIASHSSDIIQTASLDSLEQLEHLETIQQPLRIRIARANPIDPKTNGRTRTYHTYKVNDFKAKRSEEERVFQRQGVSFDLAPGTPTPELDVQHEQERVDDKVELQPQNIAEEAHDQTRPFTFTPATHVQTTQKLFSQGQLSRQRKAKRRSADLRNK